MKSDQYPLNSVNRNQTAMSFHLTPVGMTTNKINMADAGEDAGGKEPLFVAGEDAYSCRHNRNQWLMKKIKNRTSI